ncbi:SIR2 family protein [Thalassospira sp. GB04J01]|uniref:SIR2 family protein n=1 Tax=Thalassospira sp. GB04J01 TaxID=1485225 RepID=UPI000C9B0113|nr:SIR2 family protein [Thalassospira sp. GB04J01]
MLVDEIVESIDNQGPRSYYAFETFVMNLMSRHIEKQGKTFEASNAKVLDIDALAPQGFDKFLGSTVLEIKFNTIGISVSSFLDKTITRYLEAYELLRFQNLLIVSAKRIPDRIKHKIINSFGSRSVPFNVELWGPEDLNKIASKHKNYSEKIAQNLFSLRINSAMNKDSKDWKVERDEIISKLKTFYDKGQFSLFLGAGVSSSAGMPDWNTLLNSLFVSYLTQEFDDDIAIDDSDISDLVTRLNNIDEPSALMAARYLRKGLSKREGESKDFISAVTKNLYKLRDGAFPVESNLIKSIASMCLPRRTGAKVKSVVTYNFDDLLERQLKNNDILHRSIYTDNERYDPDELPLYHVHGFLPEEQADYNGLENSTLVFSEEGYHQIYSEPYHWSNLVQLNSFRESNCLMIGLSMTDPNLRRLLDISSKNIEHSKHFSFMKRLSSDEFCFEVKNGERAKAINNVDAAEKFLERHHTLNEELMKELGVNIIWYESYDEIPQFISDIAKHGS